MKILFRSKTALLVLLSIPALLFVSCEKDAKIPPTIDFTTTAGYTSADGPVARNTAFKIGITAKKTEDKDVLKTFNVTLTLDGGTATTVETLTLNASQGDTFTKDYNLMTRNQAGTEKYTFTVTNRDGLVTTKSITVTVP
jgi:hypothetical protein